MKKNTGKMRYFFTTYEKWKLFSFDPRQFISFVTKFFAAWGILIAIIFIVEPYYFQQIKIGFFYNTSDILRKWEITTYFIHPISEKDIQDTATFSGEKNIVILQQSQKLIKIKNDVLYKIENLSWTNILSFRWYNPNFNTIFSPFKYHRYDSISLKWWECVYLGHIWYATRQEDNNKDGWDWTSKKCLIIPTTRLYPLQEGYPYSLLTFSSWEWSKIKITELKNHTDDK